MTGEVRFKPGWLAADGARAAARIREWAVAPISLPPEIFVEGTCPDLTDQRSPPKPEEGEKG
jgi:hypothetical protein